QRLTASGYLSHFLTPPLFILLIIGLLIKRICTTIKILPVTQYSANAAGKKKAITPIIIGIMYSIIFICMAICGFILADGLMDIIIFCCKKVKNAVKSGKIKSGLPSWNHRKL